MIATIETGNWTDPCLSVLDGTVSNPEPSSFDQGNGSVYLIESPQCWLNIEAQIQDSISHSLDSISKVEDLHLPTKVIEDLIKSLEKELDYTDSRMLYTSW